MMFSNRDHSEPATIEQLRILHAPIVNVALLLSFTYKKVEPEHATAGHD